MKTIKVALMAGIFGLLASQAQAMDAAAGEKVFKKCKACHVVDSDKKKVGPSLMNVFGRQPGTMEGYKYSKAMIAYGEGKTWEEENMTEYLRKPKALVKGTKMAFAGLKKDQQIADLITYLKGFSKMEDAATEGAATDDAAADETKK